MVMDVSDNSNRKALAIFRIAVLTAILMVAAGVAMNGIILGKIIAVTSGVFLLYFLNKDRRYFY